MSPYKYRQIPGPVKAFAAVIATGFLAVTGLVANIFYQSYKFSNMPAETVNDLAGQIVDPKVNAYQLEEQGFYKVKYGGFYLDDCRKDILTDNFNAGANNNENALKISMCIQKRAAEASARGGYRQ